MCKMVQSLTGSGCLLSVLPLRTESVTIRHGNLVWLYELAYSLRICHVVTMATINTTRTTGITMAARWPLWLPLTIAWQRGFRDSQSLASLPNLVVVQLKLTAASGGAVSEDTVSEDTVSEDTVVAESFFWRPVTHTGKKTGGGS